MTRQLEHCELCSAPADELHQRFDAKLCRGCLTLLWFGEVLLESDVTETEVVPTLAFARYAEKLWSVRNPERRGQKARQLVEGCPALELVEVVSGVPVLRMRPAIAEIVRYEGSSLAKGVRIRVLSRFADPHVIAQLYRDACEREDLPRHGTSPGRLSWGLEDLHLATDIGPREEIPPSRLLGYERYPRVRRFAFPLDTVVEALFGALLGQGQEKNLMFGALLSDLGRTTPMSLEKAVVACVLWNAHGERSERGTTSIQRTEAVAGLINRLLLVPLDKEPVTVSRNDTSWRDAEKVSQRYDLCRYFLQGMIDRDNPFSKRLSTAP